MQYDYYQSPVGTLLLAGDDQGLALIGFPEGKGHITPEPHWTMNAGVFTSARRQLTEYFTGKRTTFELPITPQGTPFQLDVLKALQTIPYGETRSYGEIAHQLGKPKAVRAVGAANGRNPLPIIIPCHRVIGANGSLTGFGGGLKTKQFLLQLEQMNKT